MTDNTAKATRHQRRALTRKVLKPPTWRHLMHWSDVCLYLDAEPERCIQAPFAGGPPITAKLLQHMAEFKLVRHRISDCRWQLSPRWESIMQRLIRGIPADDTMPDKTERVEGDPFVVDYGIDTLYVNVKAEEVPWPLLAALAALKTQAQVDYKPLVSPWLFGESPLLVYPNGKGTGQTGGVSWGYILRNDLVEMRFRKEPLNGIVAAVHFLAQCLWLNGGKPSLDLMRQALGGMWADEEAFADVHYQTSQIHLCADIAHFPLTDAYLPCLVTRSVKRTVHLPSNADLALDDSLYDERTTASDDDDLLFFGAPPDDWDDGAYADPYDEMEEADEFPDEEDDDEETEDQDEEPVAEWHPEGAKVHWRGKAMEGIGFSPAGDISSAWYDKILEERKVKKPWMRVIHQVGGWEPGMRLTRVEMRYRRGILNELEVAHGTEKGARWFDDPYVTLDHVGEVWGFGVGYPPEYDRLPDVTYRGWMRLAIPDADSNRSRWATDPLWQVVQRVPFAQGLPKPLKRAKEAKPDLDQIDAEIRGMLVTRAMLRGSYLAAPASLPCELVAFQERITEWDAHVGRVFSEDVRERARMSGKRLPIKAPLVFPKPARKRNAKKNEAASRHQTHERGTSDDDSTTDARTCSADAHGGKCVCY